MESHTEKATSTPKDAGLHDPEVSSTNTLNSASADEGGDSKPELNPADEANYPHGFQLVLLGAATMVAVFLIALDQTIIGTAIPKITAEFDGLDDVSWYAAGYFMTFGACQTPAGKVYKYFDIKWSFVISMVIFEVGSLLCGVAPNSETLIIGRAIAGIGGAGLSVGGTAIISLSVAPAKRPGMMGLVAFTYCIAAVLGPLVGGAFTNGVSWRWCFYINLPIGGVAAVAVLFFFHLPVVAAPPPLVWWKKLLHIDPVGITLIMGAIVCFILGLQYGGSTHAWNSSTVIGLLVGFGLLIVALIIWELWLGEYSMMLPRLYKQRTMWASAPFQFFFMGSYVVLLFYLPIYFQSVLGVSPIRSGVNNLPLVLAAAIFSIIGGIFVMKTGRAQQVMMVGSALSTVAIGLIYTMDIGTSTAKWVGYQFFVGAVLAVAIMQSLGVVQSAVVPEDLAAASANLLFYSTLGGAFSSAAGQSAFINRLLAHLPQSAPSVNPMMVLATGASELHNVFPPDILPGVLEAYMLGLKGAFAVAIAFAGLSFLFSLLVPMGKLATHVDGGKEGALAMA